MWVFIVANCFLCCSAWNPLEILSSGGGGVHVTNVKTQNCGRSTDPLKLEKLSITQNDAGFDVSVKGKTLTNMTSPVKAIYKLEHKGLFGKYITLRKGTIKDMCKFGVPEDEECPAEMQKLQLPCRCPIPEGTEVVLEKTVKLPKQVSKMLALLDGDVRTRVHLEHGKEDLGCYKTTFRLS
ncbi:uncharacterized protein [Periplaneta americana]|uniref:uncharacterized protein n=1 Tax=Periplaneta americana TaxID=6978 RepID=UPI0037E918CE